MSEHQAVPILTIGYGDRSLEQFIAVLQRYHVQYVVDIRSAPYSRYKPEFSKAALERALQVQGIRYLFMGDSLGGRPNDPDCYSDDKVDYEKVKQKAFYRQGIERLQNAFHQQLPVVIMCSEGKPEMCHRSKLIGASLTELAIPVVHIDEHDALKSQTDVVFELTGGQLNLFGAPTFMSRKRYQPSDDETDELD